MIDIIKEMLSFPFMVRALVVGSLISLGASLLGVSLVLKRYSMIGTGLSNVGFGALTIAMALNMAPLSVSIPVVVFAAYMLLRLNDSGKIKGDAAIAIISTSSVAIGVMAMSLSTGVNADVCNYLFGSILGMTVSDVNISITLSIIVLIVFLLFYNRIFAVTFDENFAKATGTHAELFNTLIAILTALIIVVGMRMMGSLLISSLIVFPALSSMRVFKSFKSVIISSAIVSIICFICGMLISYNYATPSGASIVVCNIVAFIVFSLLRLIKGGLIHEKA